MKLVLSALALLSLAISSDVCPHDKQVQCITDVNHAFDKCDQAAKQKGKDQPADLQCVQFLLAVRKDCWPCICQIAKDDGFKIKGCGQSIRFQ